MINSFLLALQLLTRIPVPISIPPNPKTLGQSVLYYPLVGALIGFMLYALAYSLGSVDSNLSAALILTLWVGLTGGLHLDGIADCVDGWIGGQGDCEKSLLIMQDPNAGPMGVIALVLLLLLKFTAIAVLLKNDAISALIIAPIIGRASILFFMVSTKYLRQNGLADQLNQHLSHRQTVISLALCALCSCFFIGLLATTCMALFIYLLRTIFIKLFGGTTGDMYGASVELSELTILLLAITTL